MEEVEGVTEDERKICVLDVLEGVDMWIWCMYLRRMVVKGK